MVAALRRPIIEEIDTRLSAAQAFDLIEGQSFSFFLDSGMDPHKLGRYSFIGSRPFMVLNCRGKECSITRGDKSTQQPGNPFDILGRLLDEYRLDCADSPLPFIGGAMGYLSYDLCHFIEKLPSTAIDDLQLPECYFAFYDLVIGWDHLEDRCYVISSGLPETDEDKRMTLASERLSQAKSLLASAPQPDCQPQPASEAAELSGNFSRDEYIDAVEAARNHIIAGDIFEVNLSQRFQARLNVSPYQLYQRLRSINPAPFAAYLGFDKVQVVSASPERFIRRLGDWVETRPIKGTRRRGCNQAEDEALAKELLASQKDRAENIMIVDLERNDLGRVCRYGTVEVTELAILEVFPTVFHLTSTVTGRLNLGRGVVDLLKAIFPGGSITGAPKVRAMEIIDELEPTRRSVYTGGIGYIGFNGDLDLNIVIRTFLVKDGMAYFQAGGAVTYDSDAAAEYQETLDKARALLDALGITAARVK